MGQLSGHSIMIAALCHGDENKAWKHHMRREQM
jgi:hypothetical protein